MIDGAAEAAERAGIRPGAARLALAEVPDDVDQDDPEALEAALRQVGRDHPYLRYADASIDAGARGERNAGGHEVEMDDVIRAHVREARDRRYEAAAAEAVVRQATRENG
jgi:hypothetical protein